MVSSQSEKSQKTPLNSSEGQKFYGFYDAQTNVFYNLPISNQAGMEALLQQLSQLMTQAASQTAGNKNPSEN